ncbi:MerR family transcriptional regulator [Gracilibacillus alcaliphilus]|uniref:MerR family transcriptional regulator n=1 Tax=Gracilibacillus alcaliphilus TaxID=1401441 RepID=UPI00195C7E87|nr:MerR family transcriptional regulator [Gracilibacillus alcaliphilus]MBM7679078.1 DNA-binding transcriptional MerR regulator [Gracilibacillus alcaliphilus]
MMEEESFTVSQFATYTGVSVRTLHYYEEKGLMQPNRNQTTGHRTYKKDDAIRLHQIMTMKFLGFQLGEIKKYIQSDQLDLRFKDTLRMQEAKLKEDKERIEMALETIERTVHLIDQEQEIDSQLLFSLLSNMQSEKRQMEIAKPIMKEEVWSRLFDSSVTEKMRWEQFMLQFLKEVKRVAGMPVDDPEVTTLLKQLLNYLVELLGLDSLEDLEHIFQIDIYQQENEEQINQFLKEMEKLTYIPLTKQEEAWLEAAFGHFYESAKKENEQ